MYGTKLILMPQSNIVNVLVYDIPYEEMQAFFALLPEGSHEISADTGIFTVPNLHEAEESCDLLYSNRKIQTVGL